MSDEKQAKVEVNDLPREQEELTDDEARSVAGGGALSGGVTMRKSTEEIPQTR